MLTSNETAAHAATADAPPTINILIVADGDLSFSSLDNEALGLGRFCTMLKNAPSGFATVRVTTAHRQPDGSNTGADIHGFKFSSDELSKYAEIWLLGHESGVAFGKRPPIDLEPQEYDAIIEFMDRGGGIVAAGDHEDLGKTMCGWIPRVRSMRLWHYDPNAEPLGNAPGKDRFSHDTLIYPDNVGAMSDYKALERDKQLQMIYLVPMAKPREWGGVKQHGIVHPIFARREGGVIATLPDHMHEGECLDGPVTEDPYGAGKYGEIGGKYTDRKEFLTEDDGYIERPIICAWSISSADDKPKPFGSLAVYDGLKVKSQDGNVQHGRIVTISTWHQFVNENLSAIVNAEGASINMDLYNLLSDYYINIATWVAGSQRDNDGADPGSADADNAGAGSANLQTQMRDYAISVARSYHPLINLLGSASIKNEDLKARMVADEVYDGLRTVASGAQILEWATTIYQEREPEKRIAFQKGNVRGRTETITLLTDLGVDLLTKYAMAAEAVPVRFAALMNPSPGLERVSPSDVASEEEDKNEWLSGMIRFLRRDLELTLEKLNKLEYTPDTERPIVNNIIEGESMREETTARAEDLVAKEVTRASAFSWDNVNNAIRVSLVSPTANSTVDIVFEGTTSKEVDILRLDGAVLSSKPSCGIQGVGPYNPSTVSIPMATGSFLVRPMASNAPCPTVPTLLFANPTLDVTHCDKRFGPQGSTAVEVATYYFAGGIGESIQITITIEDVIV